MKTTMLAAALATLVAPAAFAATETYDLDPSHTQVIFSYDHLGFSRGYGMFSGMEGTIEFDAEDPAASSVEVSFPLETMITGWQARFDHFMSPDFFDDADGQEEVTFKSTGIEVTGENTALITGDLTLNGITKPVTLDTTLRQVVESHPMEGKPWMGLVATGTILRSDFGVDAFAPYVSDEVQLELSVEAFKPDAE